MQSIPKLFKKLQYLESINLNFVNCIGNKHKIGRIGYGKKNIFYYLLFQQLTNCSFRDLEYFSGIHYSTFCKAKKRFSDQHIYEKFFIHLIRLCINYKIISCKKIAIDSSFVRTYSKRHENGSAFWTKYKDKKGFGFKLHALVDAQAEIPLVLIITNGSRHDSQECIPLLERFKELNIPTQYVLADKAYDSEDIIWYIFSKLQAKASIEIKKPVGRKTNKVFGYKYFKDKAKYRCIKKSIYKKRTSVERVFSYLKNKYNLGKNRTRGVEAFIQNSYLSSINLILSKLYSLNITHF